MKNCRCSDYGVAHCLCSSRLNSQLFCEIYNVVTILSRTVCCQSALVLKLLACTASVTESMQFSYDEGTEYIYCVHLHVHYRPSLAKVFKGACTSNLQLHI